MGDAVVKMLWNSEDPEGGDFYLQRTIGKEEWSLWGELKDKTIGTYVDLTRADLIRLHKVLGEELGI